MDARLRRLLKETSRSFYLSIRVLPAAIRPQIGLAYLLARSTDAVADASRLPAVRRSEALRGMLAAVASSVAGEVPSPPDLAALSEGLGREEGRLLASFPAALEALRRLGSGDRRRIGAVLRTIASGQELDLVRFGDACGGRIAALATDEELDDYAYRVAGCVGEFWTGMCREHLFPKARLDDGALLADGVRFGKGLQLVNILRDLPRDLRQGRCYIPLERLDRAGLSPRDLLHTAASGRFRPVYDACLDRAEEDLRAGHAYVAAVPARHLRVRLACLWPLLIGRRTIELLRTGEILDAGRPIKVPRSEIRRLLLSSLRHLLSA